MIYFKKSNKFLLYMFKQENLWWVLLAISLAKKKIHYHVPKLKKVLLLFARNADNYRISVYKVATKLFRTWFWRREWREEKGCIFYPYSCFFSFGHINTSATHHNSLFSMSNLNSHKVLPFNMFITQFTVKWGARLAQLYHSITEHKSHFFYSSNFFIFIFRSSDSSVSFS